jgi:hypothetical protein
LEVAISTATPDAITDRTWWLLAKSVMSEKASDKCLEQFHVRSERMSHHTVERQRFERACADLIALWVPKGSTVKSRSEFAANTLSLLETQTELLANSPALSKPITDNSKALAGLSAEIRAELSSTGKIAGREKLGKKIADFVKDAAGHILIDTAVAGLRSILGI